LIGRRRFSVSLRQEVLEAYSPTTKVAGSSANRPNQKNRGSIEAVVQVRTNIAATVVVHVRVDVVPATALNVPATAVAGATDCAEARRVAETQGDRAEVVCRKLRDRLTVGARPSTD